MSRNDLLLPDTCAWIDYFRPSTGPLGELLAAGLSKGEVCACGVVLMELLQGVKSGRERAALADAFQALPWLETDRPLWEKSGILSADLRGKGITVPFSDVVIAALALEHRAAVLTRDRHFSRIEGLRVVGLDADC